MAEPREIVAVETPRSGVDLAILLEEFDRLLCALDELPPRDPVRALRIERAYLLWQLELDRAGAIDIERRDAEWTSPVSGAIPCHRVDRLARAARIHDVARFRICEELTLHGFARFANLLALPNSHLDDVCDGKFAGRLYSSTSTGIEINGVPRPATPPGLRGMAGGALLDTADSTHAFAPKSAWPKIEEDPFEAPAMSMEGEKLRLSLRELDRCDNEVLYDNLIDRALTKAKTLWHEGQREECYRVLLVLSAHASQDREDPARQRRAQHALEAFSDREYIEFLIERACVCEFGGVRPTQLLLQVAERAAPVVLDALDRESDVERSKQLAGMLLALGDAAVPVLGRSIARRRGSRLQLAVRLAGELQNPKLVPALANVLLDSGPALRREAGMALVHIGNFEACDVLVKALANANSEVARVAALCLGVLGENHATKPLLAALARAIRERSHRVVSGVIRALGQLDIQQGDLIALLTPLFEPAAAETGRRCDPAELRGAKSAALELAAQRSEPEARRLLLAATRDPDSVVSQKAHEILNQRDRRRID